VANPAATVRAYCDAVRIAFVPEALSWNVERRTEYPYLEGGCWHENWHRSSSIQMLHNPNYPTLENSLRPQCPSATGSAPTAGSAATLSVSGGHGR
jgi:hypothetical protein